MADLSPVPPDRVMAYLKPVPRSASVTILRARAFAGGAVAYHLLIDGKLSARIRSGEKATFFVPAGERIIEVRHPSAHLGSAGDSVTLNAAADGSYYFRIDSDVGLIKLLRTTPQSAAP